MRRRPRHKFDDAKVRAHKCAPGTGVRHPQANHCSKRKNSKEQLDTHDDSGLLALVQKRICLRRPEPQHPAKCATQQNVRVAACNHRLVPTSALAQKAAHADREIAVHGAHLANMSPMSRCTTFARRAQPTHSMCFSALLHCCGCNFRRRQHLQLPRVFFRMPAMPSSMTGRPAPQPVCSSLGRCPSHPSGLTRFGLFANGPLRHRSLFALDVTMVSPRAQCGEPQPRANTHRDGLWN